MRFGAHSFQARHGKVIYGASDGVPMMRSLVMIISLFILGCPAQNAGDSTDTQRPSSDTGTLVDAGQTIADTGQRQSDAGTTIDSGSNASDSGPLCGNGQADEAEECDDGNGVDGDGCSASCTIERGRIELAQDDPQANVERPIQIRGFGFRHRVELQVCILQNGNCRFAIGSLQSNAEGRIEGENGEAAEVVADQPMQATVGLCDEALETCSNGLALAWVVPEAECHEDFDCGNGQRCVGNQCIDAAPGCNNDREIVECPQGQVCVDGVCEDPDENRCQDNGQCPDEHLCIDGRCVERNRNCGDHNDCPMHQICDLNRGQCQGLPPGVCRDDSPCQIRCVFPPGLPLGRCIDCERDDECPVGAVCNPQGQCDAPLCNAENCPPPGRCENDRCIGGQDCNEQNCPPPNQCSNNMCIQDQAPQVCQVHGDCAGTHQCIIIDGRGACVSRCNQGDQAQFCAGAGEPNCICTMLTMTCDHQTGLCERP